MSFRSTGEFGTAENRNYSKQEILKFMGSLQYVYKAKARIGRITLENQVSLLHRKNGTNSLKKNLSISPLTTIARTRQSPQNAT